VTARQRCCSVAGCEQGVLAPLAQEGLCLDHYIEQASVRLRGALEICHRGQPLDYRTLDWLLAQADYAVQSLSQNGGRSTSAQRVKLLELLLDLANLQEYLRHHSVQLKRAD
jgi:hypothetical protein